MPQPQILANDTAEKANPKTPRALILVPTRELALQVYDEVLKYSQYQSVNTVHLHGGVSYDAQIEKLNSGVDIVIATPGRLRDLIERGSVDFSRLVVLVLDEADRMLDMGFIEDVEMIIQRAPAKRQTLLFSATMSDEIKALSQRFLKKPLMLHAAPQVKTAPKVTHIIHPVDANRKMDLLIHLLKTPPKRQILVFTRTKVKADEVAAGITAKEIFCMATHSGRTQAYRTKAMACFKDGRIQVLVATDIAARGLDIDDLSFVINYEIPNLPEDYVHRIGRTGRAGAEGQAVSLVTQSELHLLGPIQQLIQTTIPKIGAVGFAPLNFDPRITQKKTARSTLKNNRPKSRKSKGRRWE